MKDRRTHPGSAARTLNIDDFPALRDFLAGYLHEDWFDDHGTPEGAVRAFSKDANAGELDSLRQEATRFAAAIQDWPWPDARRALRSLGGAWTPASRVVLRSFLSALADSRPTTDD